MSNTFNLSQPYADGSVKVTGSDPGEVVKLYPGDWFTYKKAMAEKAALDDAHEAFDAAVNDVFAGVIAVAKQYESAVAGINVPDPNKYVTVQEGVEKVKGEKEIVVELDVHSQIVRLIETGQTNRLEWTVYPTYAEIELLAYEPPTTVVEADEIINADDLA